MKPRRIILVALLALAISIAIITAVILSTSEIQSYGRLTYLSNAPLFEIGWGSNTEWRLIKELNSDRSGPYGLRPQPYRPAGIYIEFPISPSERASIRLWTPAWSKQYREYAASAYIP